MSAKENMSNSKDKISHNKSIIIFIGPEGSGKSTIGKLIATDLEIPYVSTGDIIRERARKDLGPLGDACRKMISENAYLSPKLLLQLLTERLSEQDANNGVVLDGGLRTLNETLNFDKVLKVADKKDFAIEVFYLDVPDEIGIERRLSSKKLRPGEDRKSVLIRLSHFYENLNERLGVIKHRYNYYKIDATKPINEVYKNVRSFLSYE